MLVVNPITTPFTIHALDMTKLVVVHHALAYWTYAYVGLVVVSSKYLVIANKLLSTFNFG